MYEDADRSIVRRYEDVAIIGDAARGDRQRSLPHGWRSRSSNWRMQAARAVFELLLRMIDASGEIIAPDKFLTAAERYQLATDIDRWVVQYALEICRRPPAPLAEPGCALRDQHFRASRSATSVSAITWQQQAARVQACRPGCCRSRSDRDRGGSQHRARGDAHPALAGPGSLDRARRFGRGLSSLTYLKALPRVASEDRWRADPRCGRQRAPTPRLPRSCSCRRR